MNYNMLALQFLGIILVVVGHKGGVVLFDNFFPLYSFHMPLFIFISGYFYSENLKFKDFLVKKLKKNLFPLFVCNFVYLCVSQLLRNRDIINYGDNISLRSLFITPFTYGNQSGLNDASWFVLALILTSLFYIILRKLFILFFKNEYLMASCFLLVSLFGIYLSNNGTKNEIFIMITRVDDAIVFLSSWILI